MGAHKTRKQRKAERARRPRGASVPRPNGRASHPVPASPEGAAPPAAEEPDPEALARLALEVWRLQRRARGAEVPELLASGLERLGDRIRDLGLECRDLTGLPYDENMVVRVIEHCGPPAPRRRIAECLSPAVYFRERLLRAAEVTTKGWVEA